MGNYTEVLLTCSASDGHGTMGELNAKLSELDVVLLEECLPEAFPGTVWGAYRKDMVVCDFVALVNEQEWKLPRSVQVFVRGEHDERFSEVEVNPGEKPPRVRRWASTRPAVRPD